jgi:branched-chain amino acid transport system substrate-binding protein
MKKRNWIIVVICLLLVVLILTNKNKIVKSDNKPIVKIGVIAPMTGNYTNWGNEQKNGFLLAGKLRNKDTKYKYELYIENNAGNLRQTSLIANKFLSSNVSAIQTIFSPDTLALTELQKLTNFILFAATWKKDMTENNKFSFNHWPLIEKEVQLTLDQVEKRNYKRVAMFTTKHSGFLHAKSTFISEYKKRGKEFVGTYDINFGEKDFKTELIKVKQKNPDLLIVSCFSPELELVIKQAKEVGIKADWTAVELGFNSNQISFHEGMWYVGPTQMTEKFVSEYEKEFGTKPALFAGNSFDIYNVIVNAYEMAGKNLPRDKVPSLEDVADILITMKNFPSAYGTASVNEHGTIETNLSVYEIENGKQVLIEGK